MYKLDRHIIATITSSSLVVLFALLSIDLLGKLIVEVDHLGDKDYTFSLLTAYILGIIPLKLIEFFPMALLIGALMGLGKIAAANELTVMQTSGVSRLRIGLIGFGLAIVLGGIVLTITEFIGVPLNAQVTEMRAQALGRIRQNYGSAGVWAQDGNSFVNIKGVKASGDLVSVHIYHVDDDMRFLNILDAQTATFELGSLQLHNVDKKTFSDEQVDLKHYDQLIWKNNLNSDVLNLLLSDPEDLSIRELHRYINYQKANGIRPTSYSLTFWQRIFVPLSTGVMFLLALPFVFGSQRNSSQGKKLFIGILLGLLYFISYTSIANIILLTGAPVILGAIIPIVMFTLVSFGLLWLRG
ncbi:MAG: LPS export ABC transporter permease LptG [Gammaproteobacteria bacterium]|nr:MAG: LPS export ABC transporter permease LptG [Gammaproteobacteria bacterium]